MSNALQGKVAIITGGGRGIGASTAEVFVREGARVVIASRTENELRALASRLGENCFSVFVDVSSEFFVKNFFDLMIQKFGKLDLLVNNAAISFMHSSFADLSFEDWNRAQNINLNGCFLCCREAFRKMSKGGAIVNISSLAGISGPEKFKGFTAYSVSKYGVTGLTEALSAEAREKGLRINGIAPGAVNTDMLRASLPHIKTSAEPKDVAEIILSLCDDKMSLLNGAMIPVSTKAWIQ
jgi:NAD(P)-dependent dehydrogenase (short-subunit alcohol dehydrogenase family)